MHFRFWFFSFEVKTAHCPRASIIFMIVLNLQFNPTPAFFVIVPSPFHFRFLNSFFHRRHKTPGIPKLAFTTNRRINRPVKIAHAASFSRIRPVKTRTAHFSSPLTPVYYFWRNVGEARQSSQNSKCSSRLYLLLPPLDRTERLRVHVQEVGLFQPQRTNARAIYGPR